MHYPGFLNCLPWKNFFSMIGICCLFSSGFFIALTMASNKHFRFIGKLAAAAIAFLFISPLLIYGEFSGPEIFMAALTFFPFARRKISKTLLTLWLILFLVLAVYLLCDQFDFASHNNLVGSLILISTGSLFSLLAAALIAMTRKIKASLKG